MNGVGNSATFVAKNRDVMTSQKRDVVTSRRRTSAAAAADRVDPGL